MLRFRLGPIPVEVHSSHLLFSTFVAFWASGTRGVALAGLPGPSPAGSQAHLRPQRAYPQRAYDAACALARAGDRTQALELLGQASSLALPSGW